MTGRASATGSTGRLATAPLSGVSAIVAAQLGNAVEFFDFVVYAFFAPYIGRAFFSAADPSLAVLLALAVFGVGFVARPVGAIWLGRYADRRGRRPAMLLTIWLMTAATVAIALLPTYRQVGPLAAYLLVACRLVQGFCFGGEVGPSIAFLSEVAPPQRRGLYCAGLLAGQGAAIFAAGVFGTAMTWALTTEQMQGWGWRMPFVFAAVATPFALILRGRMPESLPRVDDEPEDARRPEAMRIVWLSLAVLGGTVANYICTYLPTYASTTLGMKAVDAISVSILVGAGTLAFALLGGWMADRFNRRRLLLSSRLACCLLGVPLFAWLSGSQSPFALWLTAILLAASNAFNGGALFVQMAESFAPRRRATSISVIYATGVALFGGTAQFVVAWLVRTTGSPLAPGWYLAATSAIALGALWLIDVPQRSPSS